jgi:hypothetical protein
MADKENGSNAKKFDLSTLDDKLMELDSNAFIEAERECRMAADPTPDIMYSAAFRARLAAKAFKVSYEDISGLKLPEYVAIISRVLNFLLKTLGEEVLRRNN